MKRNAAQRLSEIVPLRSCHLSQPPPYASVNENSALVRAEVSRALARRGNFEQLETCAMTEATRGGSMRSP